MKKTALFITGLCLLFLGLPLYADDTAIFTGEATATVLPNVLIVFDNSGSMESIIGDAYDKDKNYEGITACSSCSQYEKNTVYYLTSSNTYAKFPPNTSSSKAYTALNCTAASNALGGNTGWWAGNIKTSGTYACGGTSTYTLYRGRYLNYLNWIDAGYGDEPKSKLQIARDTLASVLESVSTSARFGLMIYNYDTSNDGGKLIAPMGSTKDQILAAVDAAVMCSNCDHNNTPLSETLASAGLYYAYKNNWAATTRTNTGTFWNPHYVTTYTKFSVNGTQANTPVQYTCQKNYVLLLTDGMPTSDTGVHSVTSEDLYSNSVSEQYFGTGKRIGAYNDGKQDNGTSNGDDSGYVDDVAKFLYEAKIFTGITTTVSSMTVGADDGSNKIVTYAIGFGDDFASGNAGNNFDYLTKVTDSNHGRGASYKAGSTADLARAFQKVMAQILVANSSFIAPVVPVSKLNKVYSGNSVYLSLFLPDQSNAFWYGNIKKFGLGSDGGILTRTGGDATDENGQINSTAHSCWQADIADGSDPKKGGAGAVILAQSTRHFYTYSPSASTRDLTHSSNNFATAAAGTLSADTIAFLTATGDYVNGGAKNWVMGDILHSKPATMLYKSSSTLYQTVIIAGSNDGFLHCFVDEDHSTPDNLNDDTLSEAWCFFPWDLTSTISDITGDGSHKAYVDGSPTIYDDLAGGKRYVSFGLRRGGSSYYSLGIGTLNTTTGEYTGHYGDSGYPYYKWKIDSTFLGTGSETLGQSWAKPLFSIIKGTSGTNNKVLLLAGGYDATHEDTDTQGTDSVGRAIYAVDAVTGALSNLCFTHANTADPKRMNYSIVELTAFDKDNDGLDDTVYAGDMGGNLFGFEDRNKDGTWNYYKIFSGSSTSTAPLKFFYEPDVTIMPTYDYVFIGTGDREHPGETTTENRLYAIRNTWSSTALTESDLKDVTSYSVYSDQNFSTQLAAKSGWFVRLANNDGEKVVSSPLLYNKIVFFTTYIPGADTDNTNPCTAGNLGTGKLYALDYLTGKAVMNFDTSNDSSQIVLNDDDRSTTLGTGIPSAPTLVVTKDGGAMLIIGTSGAGGTTGARTFTIPSVSRARMWYWKQN